MQSRPGFLPAAALAVASRLVAPKSSALVAAPESLAPARRDASSNHRSGQDTPSPVAGPEGSGRSADSPADIPPRGWMQIFSRVWTQIGEDRVVAVAAGVTFYGLLAIFPMVTALVSIYGFVADPVSITEHLRAMSRVLPGGALDVIGDQVTRIAEQPRGQLGFGFAAGLAVTLWSANAGMKAIFDALNVAYGESEKRSFIRLNLQSMTFTILALCAAIITMLAVVVLPPALAFIGFGSAVQSIVSLLRWPLLLAGVMVALAVLYRYGPSRNEPQWRWLSPGAIVAAIVWLLASLGFSFYAQNFGSYNATYGSLGAVIGFMTWMWISVTIILVGAEINAEAERQTLQDTTEGAPKPLGSRNAIVADDPSIDRR
jgi:membrane protein